MYRFRPPAGALRLVVYFEQPLRTADGAGGFAVTWSRLPRLFGRLDAIDEAVRSTVQGAETGRVQAMLTVRSGAALDGVNNDWRVVIGGDVWDIVSRYPEVAPGGVHPMTPEHRIARFAVETGVAL